MMDEQREPIREDFEQETTASHLSGWLGAVIVILVIALGLTAGYIYYQQQYNTKQISAREADTSATVTQLQNQIDTLTTKLDQATAAPVAPAAAPVQAQTSPATAKRRSAAENKRFKEMQAKIDDEQQQLKDTQDQVARAQSDLQANLDSTREDLNGSIARTHEELVSLEQRGERSYFEFDLTKAKHFHREGPIMVSLRKADMKHKRYDVAMVVDDAVIHKDGVSIYEPVWINGSETQQVQLVVNKVDKDHVHGYVSAPKYSETAGYTPVSTSTTTSSSDATTSPASSQAGTSSDSSPATTQQQPQ